LSVEDLRLSVDSGLAAMLLLLDVVARAAAIPFAGFWFRQHSSLPMQAL